MVCIMCFDLLNLMRPLKSNKHLINKYGLADIANPYLLHSSRSLRDLRDNFWSKISHSY